MATEKQLLAAYVKATEQEARYRQKSEEAAEKRQIALKGLQDKGWSLVKIAEEVGMSRQRVTQLIAKIEERQASESVPG